MAAGIDIGIGNYHVWPMPMTLPSYSGVSRINSVTLKKGGVVKIGMQKGMLKLEYKSIEGNRTKKVKDTILT